MGFILYQVYRGVWDPRQCCCFCFGIASDSDDEKEKDEKEAAVAADASTTGVELTIAKDPYTRVESDAFDAPIAGINGNADLDA